MRADAASSSQRDHRLPAPSLAACRRLRHHPQPARRGGADRATRRWTDRTVIEWDKDDLDALGMLKVDVLGARHADLHPQGASICSKQHYGEKLDARHDPEGGAGGLRHDLPRRHDRRVPGREPRADDHAAAAQAARISTTSSSRWRSCGPGPIQGDMVHPYLRRRQGLETGRTIQSAGDCEAGAAEDARRAAVPGAGDADRHRRRRLHAGRGRPAAPRHGDLPAHRHDRHVQDQDDRGHGRRAAIAREFAERCFSQIEGFGEYGFPESHAASFALLVYASAWLKCHYPDVFAAALLNAQPMGFYAPAQIVRDAREHGVEVRPVDVNHLRLGLHAGAGPARGRASACAPPRHGGRHPHHPRVAARLAQDQGLVGGRRASSSWRAAARGYRFRPRSLAAHRTSVAASSSGSPTPMPSARSASTGARRCGRRRRSAASATRTTTCRCFASRRDRHWRESQSRASPTSRCRRCRSARRSSTTTASSLSLRRIRRRSCAPISPRRGIIRNEELRDAQIGRARHRLRPRHHPPAAGLRQRRHLHDHRGRDAASPTSSSGRRRSSASARSCWARATSR